MKLELPEGYMGGIKLSCGMPKIKFTTAPRKVARTVKRLGTDKVFDFFLVKGFLAFSVSQFGIRT
jgi:hypothetical protein